MTIGLFITLATNKKNNSANDNTNTLVDNEAINDNKKVKTHNIEKMWGLGTPEDLNYYLENHK